MATQITQKLGCDGFNLIQNNNEIAGQSVFHFHMHLIPRYTDDKQNLVMKPHEAEPEELDAIKDKIVG
jgi:histidine triad (HIT) family protein